MEMPYHIFVNGLPKAQPRPRMARNGHVYNPHSADVWKEEIKACFRPVLGEPITGPVSLNVLFYLPAPKAMKIADGQYIPHAKKPDLDNLLKAVMDAMSDVGVWNDDAQVSVTKAGKWYTGGKTGAGIVVQTNF